MIDCNALQGRKRDICRGYDDQGRPLNMSEEKRLAYLSLWEQQQKAGSESKPKPSETRLPCVHRGDVTRTVLCQTCPRAAKRRVNVYACAVHGECTIYRNEHNTKACSKCTERAVSAT